MYFYLLPSIMSHESAVSDIKGGLLPKTQFYFYTLQMFLLILKSLALPTTLSILFLRDNEKE